MQFNKIVSSTPPRKVNGNLKGEGEGVAITKVLKENNGAKSDFQRGRGANQKTLLGRGGYFPKLHHDRQSFKVQHSKSMECNKFGFKLSAALEHCPNECLKTKIKGITLTNQNLKYLHTTATKYGKMCACNLQAVLVLVLISLKSDTSLFNQSPTEQSKKPKQNTNYF